MKKCVLLVQKEIEKNKILIVCHLGSLVDFLVI